MIRRNREPGYELCYLDARGGVDARVDTSQQPMFLTAPNHAEAAEARWLVWGRSVFAIGIVAVLVALGVTNVAMYSRWHDVEDGVLWSARPEVVTATEVAAGSAAVAAGIRQGDVLLAVNGSPVQTPSDVVEYLHRGHAGTRLAYTLV